jgi:bifunctional non-homologous end joining protein LigD
MLDDLHRKLEPLRRPTPPAEVPRDHRRGVHWVEPVLVAEIEHRNRTPDGRYRHPSWRGLRPDRSPHDIPPPDPAPTAPTSATPAPTAPTVDGAMQTPDGAWRVEAVHTGTSHWYRVIHDDNTIDWLTIADVERLLRQAGVDISALNDADPAA